MPDKQEKPKYAVSPSVGLSDLLCPVGHTGRGFELIEFADRYNTKCQLQQSSLADYEPPGRSAIWLGIEQERMHLDLEQVKKLVNTLNLWIETGSFQKGA